MGHCVHGATVGGAHGGPYGGPSDSDAARHGDDVACDAALAMTWRHACQCAVCCEPYSRLAASVPMVERAYSSLVCGLSGECMDDTNPPLVLPSGRIYSRRALEALDACGALVDPGTGERLALEQLRKAYFL